MSTSLRLAVNKFGTNSNIVSSQVSKILINKNICKNKLIGGVNSPSYNLRFYASSTSTTPPNNNDNKKKNGKDAANKNVSDYDAINLGEKKLREESMKNNEKKDTGKTKQQKKDKSKEEEKKDSSEPETHFLRNIFLFTSFAGMATVLYTGRPRQKDDPKDFKAWIERSKKNIKDRKNPTKKLLPDLLPEPYGHPYTLVLNLDDTLINIKWDVSKLK